ncbi:phosphopantetheine-binding protein, partial [Gluconobacter potus]|uniref:phosphopantetheine-binding protein n=1 Tax=Gluconobacter potus TaxID=2724927 RepID=UPI0039EA1126
DIGVEDSFFSAGGDSIMALNVISHSDPEINITLRDLFSHKTVRSILAKDNKYNNVKVHRYIDGDVSVFFMHPAFGLCSDFIPIANNIVGSSVYFIESPYFFIDDMQFNDTGSAVNYYIESIESKLTQVNIIVSWSLGSILGEHISRELYKKNGTNIIHIKIDPFVFQSPKDNMITFSRKRINYDMISDQIRSFLLEKGISQKDDKFIKRYFERISVFNEMIKKELPYSYGTNKKSVSVLSGDYKNIDYIYGMSYLISGVNHSSIVFDKRTLHIIKNFINKA